MRMVIATFLVILSFTTIATQNPIGQCDVLPIKVYDTLSCLGDLDQAVFRQRVNREWIRFGLVGYQGINGFENWVGYPEGFDIPPSAKWFAKLSEVNGEREIWVFYSEETPDLLYVMPFLTTMLFGDAEGNHFGAHPCGSYNVDKQQFLTMLEASHANRH